MDRAGIFSGIAQPCSQNSYSKGISQKSHRDRSSHPACDDGQRPRVSSPALLCRFPPERVHFLCFQCDPKDEFQLKKQMLMASKPWVCFLGGGA